MSLAGFDHVFTSAVETHRAEGLRIRIVAPVATVLLKIAKIVCFRMQCLNLKLNFRTSKWRTPSRLVSIYARLRETTTRSTSRTFWRTF
jgi:hypothetical protein